MEILVLYLLSSKILMEILLFFGAEEKMRVLVCLRSGGTGNEVSRRINVVDELL
jgi:hypothetical protein